MTSTTTTTLGAQGATATSQSSASVVESSSASSGYSGNTPQLFWIMINDYQIIEVFLLLQADLNEAMIEMLSQINYATFNLDWIQISFLTELQDKIKSYMSDSGDSYLQTRMQKAGFETNVFIADYLYFFIYLSLFILLHLLFYLTIRVPEAPKSTIERLAVTIYQYFTFSTYLRLFLEAYFFMMLEAMVEFKQSHSTPTSYISFIFAIFAFIFLQVFAWFSIIHYCLYRDDEEVIEGKYEVLYEGLRPNPISKFYTPFFFIRRFLMAIFIVYVENASAQISIVIILQVLAFLYLAIFRPFGEVLDNIINIINEAQILVVSAIFLTLRNDSGISYSEAETRTQVAIYIMSGTGIICFIITSIFASILIIEFVRNWYNKRQTDLFEQFNFAQSDIDPDEISRDPNYDPQNQLGTNMKSFNGIESSFE